MTDRSWLPREVNAPAQERGWVALDRVLDACDELSREGGQEALSMSRISVASGVSTNSIHRWFGSREILLASVMARQLNHLDVMMAELFAEAAASVSDSRTLIDRLIRGYIEVCNGRYDITVRAAVESNLPVTVLQRREVDDRLVTTMSELLSRCPDFAGIDDPLAQTRFHGGVVASVVRRAHDAGDLSFWASEDLDQLADRLVEMVLHSLLGHAAAARSEP